jgi:hypothetical protein
VRLWYAARLRPALVRVLLTVVTVAMFAGFGPLFLAEFRFSLYSDARGAILREDVEDVGGGRLRRRVVYGFEVDGRAYQGSYSYSADAWRVKERISISAEMPAGKPIDIRYDPADPSRSFAFVGGAVYAEGMYFSRGAGWMCAIPLAVVLLVDVIVLFTLAIEQRALASAGGPSPLRSAGVAAPSPPSR